MKQILVLDSEFGSGARTIGEKLARRLNWKLFDQALSEEIARLAKIPVDVCQQREERRDPWLQRSINLIWKGALVPKLPLPDLAILDTDRLVSIVEQVVKQAAESRPCVVVGRGAPWFLRQRDDIFCVFLFASRELRYRRVLARTGNEARAVELVDTIDEERRKFVKHYFGHEWPNRQLFHVMFNTGIGDDNTVEGILHLLNATNQSGEARKT